MARGGQTKVRILFIETPSNPHNAAADIAALAQIGHDIGAILAVDHCFCAPSLQTSLLLGADVVTHYATKYLDGQGRVLGGALVGSKELITPVVAFDGSCAPKMSAFNAWVIQGAANTGPENGCALRERAAAG